MPRVPATPARSASAASFPAASAVTPPAVREARSQPAESRARQAMTGMMLRMAVLTVGQLGLYAAAPVNTVTPRRARGGRIAPRAWDAADAPDRPQRATASKARALGSARRRSAAR